MFKTEIIEIKLRFADDTPHTKWETRPIVVRFRVHYDWRDKTFGAAQHKVNTFMQAFDGAENTLVEARWNWHDSPQGHYINV